MPHRSAQLQKRTGRKCSAPLGASCAVAFLSVRWVRRRPSVYYFKTENSSCEQESLENAPSSLPLLSRARALLMMGAVKRMPLQLCMHLAFAGAFLPSARLPSQGTLLLLRGERGGTLREGTLRGRALPCTGPGFSLRRRALPCMQAGDAAAHVAGLNAWLWERGVLVRGGVEVGSCGESGLGLIAIRQIQKGEVVASVPSNVMLQTATALNVPELEKASGLVVGLLNEAWGWGGNGGALELGDVLLAIRLLHEQRLGNASDLAPWIRMLPAADSVQTPLMWGEAEVDRLLGG